MVVQFDPDNREHSFGFMKVAGSAGIRELVAFSGGAGWPRPASGTRMKAKFQVAGRDILPIEIEYSNTGLWNAAVNDPKWLREFTNWPDMGIRLDNPETRTLPARAIRLPVAQLKEARKLVQRC
ncbi:hypothetical protein BWQ93_11650 [Sphingopyxis sp. QXT-31]|nr:hypothetical protein BWQ93_11650 [Sphingopyxis sp. QXT-31]